MGIDTVNGLEHQYILRFAVEPGAIAYAGTIRFHWIFLVDPYFTVHDEYNATVERFGASHPTLGAKVEKRLLQKLDCGVPIISYPDCEQMPFDP